MFPETKREVFSVGALNRRAKNLLESQFGLIWVSGEISNFSCPASGHWYFSLKDSDAQVRCALFRNKAQYLGFRPKDGQQVLLRARVSLYEPRGDYQLIGEYMEEAGQGALQRAFEQLKAKLAAEGLFASERKRALPAYPKAVGVITSATGAALHDVLSVLKRRMPSLPVFIYPASVQGAEAVPQLLGALEAANRRGECEVLILGRGGGSLEDLWCFNDERLARAIAASAIPVVSAVGHEVDFSIADFVADWRAPTPSAAAEAVSPDWREELAQLRHLEQRLSGRFLERLAQVRRQLEHLRKRLPHPRQQLEHQHQRLDELLMRMDRLQSRRTQALRARLHGLELRLSARHPGLRLERQRHRAAELEQRLRLRMSQCLAERRGRLGILARTLETVSPLATLARGYSITRDAGSHRVLRSVHELSAEQMLETYFTDGRVLSRVQSLHPDAS
ncbi:MAG: exodeoxyribonuclease VII large subunit [Gammaproteobacteria bacterium]|nr:exodeoxyribonuclease VII large subunit [Gammaproteobacteria bacterium]